jgi:hypothetical protein
MDFVMSSMCLILISTFTASPAYVRYMYFYIYGKQICLPTQSKVEITSLQLLGSILNWKYVLNAVLEHITPKDYASLLLKISLVRHSVFPNDALKRNSETGH